MKRIIIAIAAVALAASAQAQSIVVIHDSEADGRIIPKEIYGQFSEHLGSCIYGGLWVGRDSSIPNEDGYRKDVLDALRALQVPVLRWPGGCFADDYHWMDGIGPQEKRAKISNNTWGGTMEDNSFGTHEFLDLCEKLGCDAYVSGNVGSGTVEEMAKWVEYMTSDKPSTVVDMRKANGREKPWKVKYFGIGNEAWGCGGNMPAEYYSYLYRRYTTYLRNYAGNALCRVASGANSYDYGWTETLMNGIDSGMEAISMHYYTVRDWNHKGSATEFSDREYALTLAKAVDIENAIKGHIRIMDKADPGRKVALFVDEWGTWFDVEPGTNPGHLFQQSTMRDAMVAALSLNIFHKYTDLRGPYGPHPHLPRLRDVQDIPGFGVHPRGERQPGMFHLRRDLPFPQRHRGAQGRQHTRSAGEHRTLQEPEGYAILRFGDGGRRGQDTHLHRHPRPQHLREAQGRGTARILFI